MLQRFFIQKVMSPFHNLVYRASGGRWMAKMSGLPVLQLTTTGRKSGKTRTAPLLYVEDGDAFVVIASFGGQPNHPAWYLNLQANPSATVQIGAETIDVRAEDTEGDERTRLWNRVTEASSAGYDGYQQKTDREIPVVMLHRA